MLRVVPGRAYVLKHLVARAQLLFSGLSPITPSLAVGHPTTSNQLLHDASFRSISTLHHDSTRAAAGSWVRYLARRNERTLRSDQPGCCALTNGSRKHTSWLLGGTSTKNDANSLSGGRASMGAEMRKASRASQPATRRSVRQTGWWTMQDWQEVVLVSLSHLALGSRLAIQHSPRS